MVVSCSSGRVRERLSGGSYSFLLLYLHSCTELAVTLPPTSQTIYNSDLASYLLTTSSRLVFVKKTSYQMLICDLKRINLVHLHEKSNQLVKLHYEDCEATSNGVRVAMRRPSIPRHENTFGFLMALLNSYHHENWYTVFDDALSGNQHRINMYVYAYYLIHISQL
ncbi:Hypothetical predicted protein [Scomber scombrus]|uniref:Uncharacterized protein n=1 Tax=Scomber scombrus TaxID=13677 RepID=A0AAV1PS08_SCOSC